MTTGGKAVAEGEYNVSAIIKSADMSDEMQKVTIQIASEAMGAHDVEKDVAAFIKRELDKKYGATWHVVVGKSFGSYCTHETGNFLYFYCGPPQSQAPPALAVLVFKAG
ncbi:hypothetical protein MNV49_004437 [Pseudohyphozyma bogoriensis]|nr:hypothetical protein MNV49_004437 [Pseudohyphozyma bogoriensis]